MSESYIGQIIAVGFNFAPDGWALCDGQLLEIGQYEALFNLIGTTYGGDGFNTFALPNLIGRVALNQGNGASTPTYVLGQSGGTETVTLTANEVGGHTHALLASGVVGSSATPGPATALGQNPAEQVSIYGTAAPDKSLNPASIGLSGGGQPHENRQPYLTINYIIALSGIYPSQG